LLEVDNGILGALFVVSRLSLGVFLW
jgi:hypothetical protein